MSSLKVFSTNPTSMLSIYIKTITTDILLILIFKVKTYFDFVSDKNYLNIKNNLLQYTAMTDSNTDQDYAYYKHTYMYTPLF